MAKHKGKPVKRYGKHVIKTTMEIPRGLYRDVKKEIADRDMSMKDYIVEALEEKLGRGQLPLISDYSDTAVRLYRALSEIMGERLTEVILSVHCSKLGIPISELEPEHMKKSSALRKQILKSVGRFGPEAVEYIEKTYFQKWFEKEK